MVRIQYASRLFMNFSRLKPAPKTDHLVLAGNCVQPNARSIDDIFSYLSNTWTRSYIIPGTLEHSSPPNQPQCWQTQAELLRKKAMNYKNVYICEHSFFREKNFTLIATPLGGAFLGARHELEALDPPLKNYVTNDKTLRSLRFINEEDQSFLSNALRVERCSKNPIIVATYQLPVLDLAGNKLMTSLAEGHQTPTSLTGTVSFLSPALQGLLNSGYTPVKGWIAGASDASVSLVSDSPNQTLYTTNPATSPGYKSDWFIDFS